MSVCFAVSLDEFSHAYGLLLLVQGVSNLVGPPFAGYLFDVTRQWYLTFVLAGAFIAASGVMLMGPPCLKSIRRDERTIFKLETNWPPCKLLFGTVHACTLGVGSPGCQFGMHTRMFTIGTRRGLRVVAGCS